MLLCKENYKKTHGNTYLRYIMGIMDNGYTNISQSVKYYWSKFDFISNQFVKK